MKVNMAEYPDYEVSESDLLNFEEFCDQKYQDPNVQRLGFFKIHLSKDIKGQTSMEDFMTQFLGDVYGAVEEIIPIKNPLDNSLFGHHRAPVPDDFRGQYMDSLTPLHSKDTPQTCCVSLLEREGLDSFLGHFYAHVSKQAIPLADHQEKHRVLKNVIRKIPGWKANYEKRQIFQKGNTTEERKRIVDMCMNSEKIKENFHGTTCKCDACAYLMLEIPEHHEPIGTLYSAGIEESFQKHVQLTSNFAMVNLCYKNMLSQLEGAFAGVSFPSVYVGSCHSSFPLHIEDLSLWSFNYLIKGCPKFWTVVPPYGIGKLTRVIARCGFGGVHKTCISNLRHKFYIPLISWYIKEGIPFHVVIQKEGEGIVLLPNAAHSGGNLGPNVAEACNFGTEAWIPYGCVAMSCSCIDFTIHADLTPIVAVHSRHLLEAYANNKVLSTVEDNYFRRSTVLSGEFLNEDAPLPLQKKPRLRLTCPICPHSWDGKVRKGNVKTHLDKYHAAFITKPVVIQFLHDSFGPEK